MDKVKCIGKHILLEVQHDEITYECTVCDGVKNLYSCEPRPKGWTEIENVIRDAAWNLKIENLNELG
jgi:hypothetical protein